MVFIKVKNGSINLNTPIHNDDNNNLLGVYSMILKGNNFINIESDCCIQIKQNLIEIKKGRYSIKQLNKQIDPVIISFEDVNNKIKIESSCYYNLDENLKKYLGFENTEFDFSIVSSHPIIFYHPNSNDNYININKQCAFRLGRNGQIPLGTIFIGVYSISEIENVFNSFGAKFVINFPKISLELIEGVLNITASIGLYFDEYLSKCLGMDYIGYLIPINKVWPKSFEVGPAIKYKIKGSNNLIFYTQSFIKNISGTVFNENNKTELKGNYSFEQLNSLLPSNIKLENINNHIKISTKDYYVFDQNLYLSLGGFDKNNLFTHVGLNSSLNNNNKTLEVHCNIIEESFSHDINTHTHYCEELLFLFKYDSNNVLIQPNQIIYRPVSKNRFQKIEINIFDLKGNIINFDEECIVVLDLINK